MGSAASSHSTGVGVPVRAHFSASSAVEIGTISRAAFTFSGTSSRSFSFSCGISTVFTPERRAASSFSFRPPMAVTRPRRVISPVMAMSLRIGMPVRTETMATVMATPAEGPSLGVAPSGTWTWMSVFSNTGGLTPMLRARLRT